MEQRQIISSGLRKKIRKRKSPDRGPGFFPLFRVAYSASEESLELEESLAEVPEPLSLVEVFPLSVHPAKATSIAQTPSAATKDKTLFFMVHTSFPKFSFLLLPG